MFADVSRPFGTWADRHRTKPNVETPGYFYKGCIPLGCVPEGQTKIVDPSPSIFDSAAATLIHPRFSYHLAAAESKIEIKLGAVSIKVSPLRGDVLKGRLDHGAFLKQ
jgi:hypothetical protein